MRRRFQTAVALWLGCGLLGGCTGLDMEAPGDDMQAEDSGLAGGDASLSSDLSDPPFDPSGPVADLTRSTTDGGEPGMTLQGGFVGGAVTGTIGGQGSYQLRGQFLWHGAISGSGGGYTLSGWLL